jgi:tetratricopeptide (TPR) repeat protein
MSPPHQVNPTSIQDWRVSGLVAAALVVLTLAAYSRVGSFDFTNFDDPDYVIQNEIVHRGLTFEGVKWAFTTGFMGNWHPLTWLSHMLDCKLFGVDPGAHHVSSLVIHCLNTTLLFWILFWYTRALERSAFVAALFTLHPLHVESVAWIAERKDVLSGLFWLLTMWSYLRYVERRSAWRYLMILVWFALGLMSKPMLVTLPFVLLLLDYWPLRRAKTREAWQRVIIEKVPLFLLTTASCVITFIVQQEGGAVGSIEKFSVGTRVGTAFVAYAAYLGKTLLPENLAVFYAHPGTWPMWQVMGAAILLGIITSFAALARACPYLILGWLWFVGTLVPVIGLVQVGEQAYADRYTYIPLIGLFIAIVWGTADVSIRFRWPAIAVRAVGVAGLIVCAGITSVQVGHWRNSETLFRHALAVTKDNHVAHYNFGQTLSVSGRLQEAVEHYRATLQLKPDHEGAHNNLGLTHAIYGRWSEATNHYAQALRANPGNADVHFNMAMALSRLGDSTNAIAHLNHVLQLNPKHAQAAQQMAEMLKSGRP